MEDLGANRSAIFKTVLSVLYRTLIGVHAGCRASLIYTLLRINALVSLHDVQLHEPNSRENIFTSH